MEEILKTVIRKFEKKEVYKKFTYDRNKKKISRERRRKIGYLSAVIQDIPDVLKKEQIGRIFWGIIVVLKTLIDM